MASSNTGAPDSAGTHKSPYPHCHVCQTRLELNWDDKPPKFCPDCGAAVTFTLSDFQLKPHEFLICPKCSDVIRIPLNGKRPKFCSKCGHQYLKPAANKGSEVATAGTSGETSKSSNTESIKQAFNVTATKRKKIPSSIRPMPKSKKMQMNKDHSSTSKQHGEPPTIPQTDLPRRLLFLPNLTQGPAIAPGGVIWMPKDTSVAQPLQYNVLPAQHLKQRGNYIQSENFQSDFFPSWKVAPTANSTLPDRITSTSKSATSQPPEPVLKSTTSVVEQSTGCALPILPPLEQPLSPTGSSSSYTSAHDEPENQQGPSQQAEKLHNLHRVLEYQDQISGQSDVQESQTPDNHKRENRQPIMESAWHVIQARNRRQSRSSSTSMSAAEQAKGSNLISNLQPNEMTRVQQMIIQQYIYKEGKYQENIDALIVASGCRPDEKTCNEISKAINEDDPLSNITPQLVAHISYLMNIPMLLAAQYIRCAMCQRGSKNLPNTEDISAVLLKLKKCKFANPRIERDIQNVLQALSLSMGNRLLTVECIRTIYTIRLDCLPLLAHPVTPSPSVREKMYMIYGNNKKEVDLIMEVMTILKNKAAIKNGRVSMLSTAGNRSRTKAEDDAMESAKKRLHTQDPSDGMSAAEESTDTGEAMRTEDTALINVKIEPSLPIPDIQSRADGAPVLKQRKSHQHDITDSQVSRAEQSLYSKVLAHAKKKTENEFKAVAAAQSGGPEAVLEKDEDTTYRDTSPKLAITSTYSAASAGVDNYESEVSDEPELQITGVTGAGGESKLGFQYNVSQMNKEQHVTDMPWYLRPDSVKVKSESCLQISDIQGGVQSTETICQDIKQEPCSPRDVSLGGSDISGVDCDNDIDRANEGGTGSQLPDLRCTNLSGSHYHVSESTTQRDYSSSSADYLKGNVNELLSHVKQEPTVPEDRVVDDRTCHNHLGTEHLDPEHVEKAENIQVEKAENIQVASEELSKAAICEAVAANKPRRSKAQDLPQDCQYAYVMNKSTNKLSLVLVFKPNEKSESVGAKVPQNTNASEQLKMKSILSSAVLSNAVTKPVRFVTASNPTNTQTRSPYQQSTLIANAKPTIMEKPSSIDVDDVPSVDMTMQTNKQKCSSHRSSTLIAKEKPVISETPSSINVLCEDMDLQQQKIIRPDQKSLVDKARNWNEFERKLNIKPGVIVVKCKGFWCALCCQTLHTIVGTKLHIRNNLNHKRKYIKYLTKYSEKTLAEKVKVLELIHNVDPTIFTVVGSHILCRYCKQLFPTVEEVQDHHYGCPTHHWNYWESVGVSAVQQVQSDDVSSVLTLSTNDMILQLSDEDIARGQPQTEVMKVVPKIREVTLPRRMSELCVKCGFKPKSDQQLAEHYTDNHIFEILSVFNVSHCHDMDTPISNPEEMLQQERKSYTDLTARPQSTPTKRDDQSTAVPDVRSQVACGQTGCDAMFVSSVDFYQHLEQKHSHISIKDALCRCTTCDSVMGMYSMDEHRDKCCLPEPSLVQEGTPSGSMETEQPNTSGLAQEDDPYKEKDYPTQCHKCGIVFTRRKNFNRHLDICGTDGTKLHKCSDCESSFTRPDALKKHFERYHANNKRYPCPICIYSSPYAENTASHIRIHFQEFVPTAEYRRIECFICGISTAYPARKRHAKMHFRYNAGPHYCKKCGTEFKSYHDLKQHDVDHDWSMSLPDGIEPFRCSFCDDELCKLTEVLQHMKRHYGMRERFPAINDQLKISQATSKPSQQKESVTYVCPLCEYRSSSWDVMTRHAKSHYKDKSHQRGKEGVHICAVCLKSFTNKKSLSHHLTSSHFSQPDTVRCAKCYLVLRSSRHGFEHGMIHQQLDAEEETTLAETYQCRSCLEPIKSLKDMFTHLNRHPGRETKQCDVCDLDLVTNDDFLSHGQISTSKYMCGLCSHEFDSREEFKRHLDDEHPDMSSSDIYLEYTCSPCGEGFDSMAQYEDHLEKFHSNYALCILCFTAFDTVTECIEHLTDHYTEETHTRLLSHVCLFCGDLIQSIENALTHAKSHYEPHTRSEKKTMMCKHCSQSISSYEEAETHYKEHTKDPPGQKTLMCCLFCNAETFSHNGLTIHMKTHFTVNSSITDDIYVRCLKCRFITSRVYALGYHCRRDHDVTSVTNGINRLTFSAPHKCRICSMTFFDKSKYKRHLTKGIYACEGRVYQCECCNFVARDKSHFDQHISEIHEINNQFRCQPCGSVFVFRGDFVKHLESRWTVKLINEQETSSYMCNHCDSKFDTKELLDNHLQTLKRSLYQTTKESSKSICPECNSQVSNLEVHQRKVHYARKCEFCDYVTTNGLLLSEHKREKHAEKVYCRVCKLDFSHESGLRHHLAIIIQLSKSENKQKGIDPGILDLHLMEYHDVLATLPSQTTKDSVSCEICNRDFRHQKHLQSHMANVHDVLGQYECEHCPLKFNTRVEAENHQGEAHKYVVCRDCDQEFTDNKSLELHIKTDHAERKIACPHCRSLFMNRAGLMSHIKSRHPQTPASTTTTGPKAAASHTCTHCGESFTFQSNLEQHTELYHNDVAKQEESKLESHRCKLCPKSFISKRELNKHCRSSHKVSNDGKDEPAYTRTSRRSRGEGRKRHECEKCGATFSMTTTLKQHMEEEHADDSDEEEETDTSGDEAVISSCEDDDEEYVREEESDNNEDVKDDKNGEDGGEVDPEDDHNKRDGQDNLDKPGGDHHEDGGKEGGNGDAHVGENSSAKEQKNIAGEDRS